MVYIDESFAPKRKKEPKLLIINSTEDWWYENCQKLFDGCIPYYSSDADKTGDVPFEYFYHILEKEDPDVHHRIKRWKGVTDVIKQFIPEKSNHKCAASEVTEAACGASSSSHNINVSV